MRHQPAGIDAVAGKAAAEMVIDAALAEMGQGGDDGLAVVPVAGAPVEPPEEIEDGSLGEFGGAAEAAIDGVDGLEKELGGGVEPVQVQFDGWRCQMRAISVRIWRKLGRPKRGVSGK
jgi:hypothetical protein